MWVVCVKDERMAASGAEGAHSRAHATPLTPITVTQTSLIVRVLDIRVNDLMAV